MSPRLAQIRIYPIKSLDGKGVEHGLARAGAGLEGDREYRLVDGEGRVVNSKKLGARLIPIRATFDSGVSLEGESSSIRARLPDDAPRLAEWLSEQVGREIRLERDARRGFPDDSDASGPTVISRATLETIASWFPPMTLEEARRRFRANLEIDGAPPFWEDRLYGREGEKRFFEIGGVRFEAVNPCQRCAVPSMDSRSGRIERPDFAKVFAERRAETLPAEVERSRFNHFYRVAVNTRLAPDQPDSTLSVGDQVVVL